MKELRFVDVGEGITEGHVRKWMVKDGDAVKEDQTLVQVETDKAVVNLPAPIDGTIKIAAPENTTLKVGDYIAYVGTAEELASVRSKHDDIPQRTAITAPVGPVSAKPISHPHEVLATPYVRKLARDLGIDIMTVTGTGPNNRILGNDIRGHKTASTPQKVVQKFSETLEERHTGEIERVQLSQTRKAIAKNMEASWTIPRATHMDIMDATALFRIVSGEKERVMKERNVKLTFLPFVIKAVVQALKENPNFNASYDHERIEIIRKKYYNIGIAAEAPDGLKVVVIKEADKKGILDIAAELGELGTKVRNQTITLDEMQDSTFTITNIGSLGGGFLSVPMINYPDVGILAIHLVREAPVVSDGMVKIGRIMPFSVAFDHRVVDGFEAVGFGNALMKYIQDPEFLEML